jgi:hypothetical protein
MATALKLSETMIGALASVYNSATPGKPNTMDALEKRGLITYKSGQVVITAEGREAISADNDLIGVQDGGVVLYGSVQAFERSINADEIQEELNINPCDEISLPNRGKATISEEEKALEEIHEHGVTNARKNTFDSIEKFTVETGDPVRVLALNDEGRGALGLPIQWDAPVITEEEKTTFAEMVEAFKGIGEGWSNTQVWDGLTRKEIQADIKTAMPDNRKTRRERNRIVTNVSRRNWFRMSGESRKQTKICGAKG